MGLTNKEIDIIINNIKETLFNKTIGVSLNDSQEKTIVLVPAIVPSTKRAVQRIDGLFGKNVRFFFLCDRFFDTEGFEFVRLDIEKSINELFNILILADKIVILAPSLRQLKNLSAGNDDGYVETATLKAILWGKDVQILLDFDPPKFKRGSFFETLVESIDALTAMGVKINTYQAAENKGEGKTGLVTEDQVTDAYKNGQKTVYTSAGAIVTPLARDKARELKINIE